MIRKTENKKTRKGRVKRENQGERETERETDRQIEKCWTCFLSLNHIKSAFTVIDGILDSRANKTHTIFSRPNQVINVVKKTTNIKHNEINIMSIINDKTFNLQNSFLNNDCRYMKVTGKYKTIGVTRQLISAEYREFLTDIWHITRRGILNDILKKKTVPYIPSNTVLFLICL